MTRTPRPAHSTASVRVSPTTPALLDAYGARHGMPTVAPTIDATFTIDPCPASSMRAPAARQQRKTPVRLTSRMRSQSSSGYDSDGPMRLTPALLTRIVGVPSAAAAAATASSTAAL